MTQRLNERIVASFDELGQILTQQGESFRAKAYKNASDVVQNIEFDITDSSQLKDKKGIGKTMLEKISEIQNTGTLSILEKERLNPVTQLTKIFGIGPKKAKDLIQAGIDSIEKLKQVPSKDLTPNINKGIKYFDDISERIPRSEIDDYLLSITKIASVLKSQSSIEGSVDIVGSYRRGVATSGDIDVIITSNNASFYNMFLDVLIKDGIIVDMLTRGKMKSMCVSKLPGKKHRRLDVLYSPPDEYAFSTLYFTGSKQFNTIQRYRASQMGYTLNEHGLYNSDCKQKVNCQFHTERDIFDFLKMEYISPKQRSDTNNVKYL